jgi:hypothetical protein
MWRRPWLLAPELVDGEPDRLQAGQHIAERDLVGVLVAVERVGLRGQRGALLRGMLGVAQFRDLDVCHVGLATPLPLLAD